jgi:hypothetical protein
MGSLSARGGALHKDTPAKPDESSIFLPKFTYLELRPPMAGPTIIPVFALPQHPGFPSGHACASGAASAIMSYPFPSDAASFAAMAQDAGNSTFYALIHSMFDVAQGLQQGGEVGQMVVQHAAADGSQ